MSVRERKPREKGRKAKDRNTTLLIGLANSEEHAGSKNTKTDDQVEDTSRAGTVSNGSSDDELATMGIQSESPLDKRKRPIREHRYNGGAIEKNNTKRLKSEYSYKIYGASKEDTTEFQYISTLSTGSVDGFRGSGPSIMSSPSPPALVSPRDKPAQAGDPQETSSQHVSAKEESSKRPPCGQVGAPTGS